MQNPDILQAIDLLKVHEHLCLIYSSKEEQLTTAIPFIRKGLEKGEKCVYIADENTASEIISYLETDGVDIQQYIDNGAFELLTKRESYHKNRQFDPDTMLSTLIDMEKQASIDGYPNIRITGEMTWALGEEPGNDRLLEYEAKINYITKSFNGTIICQYNKNKFSSKIIKGILKTHPKIIYRELVSDNPYYVPPDELLRENHIEKEVNRLLENIVSRQYDINRLREQRTELKKTNERLLREIIERKAAEEKIKEQALLLGMANEAIIVTDANFAIKYMNESAEQLFGWDIHELEGNKIKYYINMDQLIVANIAEEILSKGVWNGEIYPQTKHGKRLTVEVRATKVRNEIDEVSSILFIIDDITEKKLIEEQFLRKQRVESIGHLVGGISHDLNNIFTPILLSIELLQNKDIVIDNEIKEMVQIISHNANRGAALVKQLLNFQKGTRKFTNKIHLQDSLDSTLRIVKDLLASNIELVSDIDDNFHTCIGDRTQIEQIFMNLIINAKEAMPNGGTISIKLENLKADREFVEKHIEAEFGNYVKCTIKDTGHGIPSDILDKIFEPFFTTKNETDGTGLGLSTVYNIVENHNGFIEVDSVIGEGTSFSVYLPAQTDIKEEPKENLQIDQEIISNKTVLIADDEIAIRRTIKSGLQNYGYQILQAKDGQETLDIFSKHFASIDYIILDRRMPQTDVFMLIPELRNIKNNITIILISGYLNDIASNIDKLDIDHIIQKPFTFSQILKAFQ